VDGLSLTAVDKALLQQTAAHKRTSKAAGLRIAFLGGTAEAAKLAPELVQSRQAAGRALRSLYEAQGFKKPRATKAQREARQQRQVARARAQYQAALEARATSNQQRAFNELLDAPSGLAPINPPKADHSNWRKRDGVLRDRTDSEARRKAQAQRQRERNTAPQLPPATAASEDSKNPASAPAESTAAATSKDV
jgi:hypothetical protein